MADPDTAPETAPETAPDTASSAHPPARDVADRPEPQVADPPEPQVADPAVGTAGDHPTRLPEGLVLHADGLARCWWCGHDDQYVAYHDTEWGVPVHDEGRLFEKLCLEGFQAGLSWLTILRKRAAFREAFEGFDPATVARYGDTEVARLLHDARIVRNRAKITATISGAAALLELHARGETLDALVWRFAPSAHPAPRHPSDVPVTTPEATALSAALKGCGFRFVGPTTVYAFMQSMGLVNDHLVGCWRRDHPALGGRYAAPQR